MRDGVSLCQDKCTTPYHNDNECVDSCSQLDMYVQRSSESPQECVSTCVSGYFRKENDEWFCSDECPTEKYITDKNDIKQCVPSCLDKSLQEFAGRECR